MKASAPRGPVRGPVLPLLLLGAMVAGLVASVQAAGSPTGPMSGGTGFLDTLEDLDAAIAGAEAARRRAAETSRKVEGEVTSLRESTAAKEAEATRIGGIARHRTRSLYLASRGGALATLAGADSFADFLRRDQLVTFSARRDLGTIRTYLETRREERAMLLRLEARSAALLAVRSELTRFDAAARKERERKAGWIAEVTAAPAGRAAAHAALDAAARSLDTHIARMAAAPAVTTPGGSISFSTAAALEPAPFPTSTASFKSRRGALPWPVVGAVLDLGFGTSVDETLGTTVHRKGWDLVAPEGTPVAAVHAGRVVFAGWYKGYGNVVIVDHGDGFHTLAAHLSSISKGTGETIDEGDLVGTVGDTGSLKGPYLYFEIRRKGHAVDPAGWLAPDGA